MKKEFEKLNLIGKRFTRLLVLSLIGTDMHGNRKWDCVCDCGKHTQTSTSSLLGRRSKSCGCFRVDKRRLDYGEANFNLVYRSYKYRAKIKNISFELLKDEFKYLTQQNCYYCNSEPSSKMNHNNRFGEFIYNGIDRLDSTKGYIKNNCVSCCILCNQAKMDLSKEEFLKHIEKIYRFNKGET